jgi:dihydroorotate dehydrogenase (fumarate)
MLLAGADVTMLCSVFATSRIEDIGVLERELREWLERSRHESVAEVKGLVSHKNCSNPSAFERAHYARALDPCFSWLVSPTLPDPQKNDNIK